MGDTSKKQSYTIPCSSAFRDAILDLARRRRANVGDLARSVALVVPPDALTAVADPGEPSADDRETVVLKSGPSKGRPWRRKPRLQVRMASGYDVATVRRALALALALDRGERTVRLEGADDTASIKQTAALAEEATARVSEMEDEVERLKTIVSVLAFEPLPGGVRGRDDALHVLGFPPGAVPDIGTLKARFRMLATVHHPDGHYGSHQRMSQLNTAMELLVRGGL